MISYPTQLNPDSQSDIRVQPTDTRLSIIAEKALGDGSRWPEIAKLNNISKENPYRAGDCLQLPAE